MPLILSSSIELSGSLNVSGEATFNQISVSSGSGLSTTKLDVSGSTLISGSLVMELDSFRTVLSGQLLQNGNFDGNADGWITGSYGVPDVVYYQNNISCSNTGGDTYAYTEFPVESDKYYRVNFVLSNVTGDGVWFEFCGYNVLFNIGDGEYQFDGLATFSGSGTVGFMNFDLGGTYIVDSVQVVEVGQKNLFTIYSGSTRVFDICGNDSTNVSIGINAGLYSVPRYNQNTVFVGSGAGFRASNCGDSVILGTSAGSRARYRNYSVMIGNFAGSNSEYYEPEPILGTGRNTFIGESSGQNSSGEQNVYIGSYTGTSCQRVVNSVFLGEGSGQAASSASYSCFMGYRAGNSSYWASHSVFIGNSAGFEAGNQYIASGSYNAVMIGQNAGAFQYQSNHSIFIGLNAGRSSDAGWANFPLDRNNIIIGTNVTLANGTRDSINIAGLIFATGSYFSEEKYMGAYDSFVTPSLFSGSANGKVGINQPLPQYSLDVSGSIGLSDVLVLATRDPLPTLNVPTGSIMSSGSNADNKPYYWNGATWTALF